jgi:hypothetical protein
MGAQAVGGLVTAAGTLAGGSYAAAAGKARQQELNQESSEALAAGQRRMLDTREKTQLLESTIRARAGASGVDPSTGSPATTVGDVAQRGEYHALMDMFNAKSTADRLRYEGELAEDEGRMKKTASYYSAAGTLAGTAGSMAQTYGYFNYPTTRGYPGTRF